MSSGNAATTLEELFQDQTQVHQTGSSGLLHGAKAASDTVPSASAWLN